jgi:serine/threonine protein kinase
VIGTSIKVAGDTYTINKEISVERENADIYLCENAGGQKFIIKYFCNITPRSNIAYGVYNHFGRGRDGSRSVFDEIRRESALHDFIVTHYERVRYDGSWLIIMEFIEGVDLRDFLVKNYTVSFDKVLDAVKALAQTLANWHNHGFAHGDPHLENAILHPGGSILRSKTY